MRLWFRLFLFLLASPFAKRFSDPLETSKLQYHVLPTDIDTNIHLNNGQYLTLMDIGRIDILLRAGLWRAVWKNKWMPVVSAASIRFRREIGLFQKFQLESRIVYWNESTSVIEQRFRLLSGKHKGVVAASALVRVGMYDRKARAFVQIQSWMNEAGISATCPPIAPHVEAFLQAEEQQKLYDRATDEPATGHLNS
ncbi:thioesterase family protein [Polycladidibacter hongkongensis]|uniref:thioesterase family protein n=1 Tax=Polycladidibacter hongkongensis TaxID=1647556 RepID=UPI00082ABE9E|nr:thioesterase family protein [Pseudovibrio hongkongensis]